MKSLNESREIIKQIRTYPPSDIEDGYRDSHSPIHPFGRLWGRGVLFSIKSGYYASVGDYSQSHVSIKSKFLGYKVEKTFYFGLKDGVLYIFPASIGSSSFNNKELKAILEAIINEEPLKGSILKIN